MPGKKGMVQKAAQRSLRQNIWRSIRILKSFTIRQIVVTVPGATYGNTCKFLAALCRHGYISKIGGYRGGNAGEYQGYALNRGSDPIYPTICCACSARLSSRECISEEEREKEKEREEEPPEVIHDAA